MAASSSTAVFAPDLGEEDILWLSTYREDLSALGLAAGVVGSASTCVRSCELLEPLGTFQARPPATTFAAVSRSTLPAAHYQSLVPDPERCTSPCGRMQVRSISLHTTSEPRIAERDGDGALVGTEDGVLLRVDVARGQAETWCTGIPGVEASARRENKLFVGRSGVTVIDLTQVVPGAPCPIAAYIQRPGSDLLRSLLVLPDGAQERIFATTSSGAVIEYRGNAWRTWATLSLQPGDVLVGGTLQGNLAVLDDQEVVATVGSTELFRFRDPDGPRVEVPEIDSKPLRIRALTNGGRLGVVLAADDLGLVYRAPNGWVRMAPTGAGWSLPGMLIPVGPRLLFSATASDLVPVYPGFGECPAATGVGLSVPDRGVALDDDRALILKNRPFSHYQDPAEVAVVEWSAACGAVP